LSVLLQEILLYFPIFNSTGEIVVQAVSGIGGLSAVSVREKTLGNGMAIRIANNKNVKEIGLCIDTLEPHS